MLRLQGFKKKHQNIINIAKAILKKCYSPKILSRKYKSCNVATISITAVLPIENWCHYIKNGLPIRKSD